MRSLYLLLFLLVNIGVSYASSYSLALHFPMNVVSQQDSLPPLNGLDSLAVDCTPVYEIGYGRKSPALIGSSIKRLTTDDFNPGLISDPLLLIQGRLTGLQFNRRGSDLNRRSLIRIRGASLAANPDPLIVIDGMPGADLRQVDPNDIEEITILRDASATTVYGTRAAAGAIVIRTKGAEDLPKGWQLSYQGQTALSEFTDEVPIMNADEFRAVGGNDLGGDTNWPNEITRTGWSQAHGLAAAYVKDGTSLRFSNNYRQVEGILKNSGFRQWNSRLNLQTSAGIEQLQLSIDGAFTFRATDYSFPEAFYYATIYNPSAPIRAAAPTPFTPEQFGGYFEQVGLFDAFNPVSIVDQNIHASRGNHYTIAAKADYQFTPDFTISTRLARQTADTRERAYYPITSLFRGNAASPTRRGQADYLNNNTGFNLLETYASYARQSKKVNTSAVFGYSYQTTWAELNGQSYGELEGINYDFRNSFDPPVTTGAEVLSAFSSYRPEDQISALFMRYSANWSSGLFAQASARVEHLSRLGANSSWLWLPAFSIGFDFNEKWQLPQVEYFKLRAAYGINRSFPYDWGLGSAQVTSVTGGDYPIGVTVANNSPGLVAEQHQEVNLGVDFASRRFRATIDLYQRQIQDIIILTSVDPIFGVDPRYENQGRIATQGAELTLSATIVDGNSFRWSTGLVASTFRTKLEEYSRSARVQANLGSPGLNGTPLIILREGEEIGQIWGPVFAGVGPDGQPLFEDLNRDNQVIASPSAALDAEADYQVLGNGIPDLTFGWMQHFQFRNWSLQALFRGAFGHSLVNTFRTFYEPQSFSPPPYNQVITELAIPELRGARFSSLYVEEADFITLDNLTLTRRFAFMDQQRNLTISLTGQNLWQWTNYTGLDPEPALVDYGPASGGGFVGYNSPDLSSPGIDRRYHYWPARTITFGLRLEW